MARVWRERLGIRAQLLVIALVPSLTVVIVGGTVAARSLADSSRAQDWSERVLDALPQTERLVSAIQRERLYAVAYLAGDDTVTDALTTARTDLDTTLIELTRTASDLRPMAEGLDQDMTGFDDLAMQLPAMRAATDDRVLGVVAGYTFYNGLMDAIASGASRAWGTSPDTRAAVEIAESAQLLAAADALSRSLALTLAFRAGDDGPDFPAAEFIRQEGFYRTGIAGLRADIDDDQRQRLEGVLSSAEWARLGEVGRDITARIAANSRSGPKIAPGDASVEEEQRAAEVVIGQLIGLWVDQNHAAQQVGEANAADGMRNSQLLAAALATASLVAVAVSLVLANRTTARLRRLRTESMELAEHRLPALLSDLAAGEQVDAGAAVPRLDFGTDEIGEVAAAFEHAARTAVEAAVGEARAREDVESVFLHIAHRSQMVVHRQLELLDAAESKQEDPQLLDIFFRLDHLVTRDRRNTENLIILGGGQVGRRWQNPVPLLDLVRSAIAETTDYRRVQLARMPAVYVVGAAVADLTHLLAELVDNAASFSPPSASVEITGNEVGRGIAVVIEDQGLGMTPDQLAQANTVLAAPENFDVAALSSDSRLGLFVISRLAARHQVTVKLVESASGGLRAIVLIPSAVVVTVLTSLPAAGDR